MRLACNPKTMRLLEAMDRLEDFISHYEVSLFKNVIFCLQMTTNVIICGIRHHKEG